MFLPCLLFKVANCDLEFGTVSEWTVFIEFFKVANCDLELYPPASLGATPMPLAKRARGNGFPVTK